jgi:hypothetical protein
MKTCQVAAAARVVPSWVRYFSAHDSMPTTLPTRASHVDFSHLEFWTVALLTCGLQIATATSRLDRHGFRADPNCFGPGEPVTSSVGSLLEYDPVEGGRAIIRVDKVSVDGFHGGGDLQRKRSAGSGALLTTWWWRSHRLCDVLAPLPIAEEERLVAKIKFSGSQRRVIRPSQHSSRTRIFQFHVQAVRPSDLYTRRQLPSRGIGVLEPTVGEFAAARGGDCQLYTIRSGPRHGRRRHRGRRGSCRSPKDA